MKIKSFLLILATICLCACTIGCNDFNDTDSNNYNVRYETVTAKITKLLYVPERKIYDVVYSQLTNIPIIRTIPAKGYITIQYNEMIETFNNLELYYRYKSKLNQEIEAKLKITSKNGEDVEWQLILEQ